jgi:hypothetical protein
MAMRGNAAIAMWWDMSADMRQEFETWHAHEHFPERLAIPGFLRGSRWMDADDGEGVFVLYELESFAVLSSERYLARLNAPTPWSVALMPHHRHMIRAQAHVEGSCGGVAARYAATLRFSLSAGDAHAATAALLPRLQSASEEAGIVGAHLLRHETPRVALTTEQKIRVAPDKPGDWVLIFCGYARERLEDAAARFPADLSLGMVRDGDWRTYTLSYSAIRSDVGA